MRFHFVITVFLFLGALSVNAQNDSVMNQKQKILGSINSLKDKDCVSIGYGENPSKEELRNFEIIQSFYLLNQLDLEKLMNSDLYQIRLYAFGAYSSKYPNLAQNPKLEIFHDTSSIWVCTTDGRINMGISVSDFAKDILESSKSERELADKELDVKKAIKNFIMEYAANPESYKSISFESYTVGQIVNSEGAIEDTEHFEIKHNYTIVNKEDKEIEVSHYFKLNHLLEIVIIETDLSRAYDQTPRITVNEWIEQFGREISSDEAESLRIEGPN